MIYKKKMMRRDYLLLLGSNLLGTGQKSRPILHRGPKIHILTITTPNKNVIAAQRTAGNTLQKRAV